MTLVIDAPDPPADPAARGPALREWLSEARKAAAEAHRSGEPATAITAAWAEAISSVLRDLFRRAAEPGDPPVGLVGLGGIARGEVAPYSDIDVVLVAHDVEDPRVERLVNDVLYPLWDARLEVGHSVRTPEQFASLAESDDTVRTAAADWTPLDGDSALLQELGAALERAAKSESTRNFVVRTLQTWIHRRRSATVHRLEPDIKNGPGGLREVHRLRWLAKLAWGQDHLTHLRQSAAVDPWELESVTTGRDFLLGVRLAMHFVARRRQDVLRFDLQEAVAEHLRITDGPGQRTAADVLLESFYREAKNLRRANALILERFAEALQPGEGTSSEDVEGFRLYRGRLRLKHPDALADQPLDLLRIFRVGQRHGRRIHVHARTALTQAAPELIGPEHLPDPEWTQLLVSIITDPTDRGESLELLHEVGVLDMLLPELGRISGLVQRDTYHTYTVDAHLVFCARRGLELLEGEPAEAPQFIRDMGQRCTRPHVLVLGCLFHDIGKGFGHGHSERGAKMADEIGNRWGLRPEDIEDLVFLVQEHLIMFKLSQRRDMEDPELIGKFAEEVGTLERLELLTLLSYADASTTGPSVWNDWKASLLRELYMRTRDALASKDDFSLEELAQQRAVETVGAAGDQGEQVEKFLSRLPPRHIASHDPVQLLQHFQHTRADAPQCTIVPNSERGGWDILIVGPDRPGLLSDITKVLASHGVSIEGADISGTTDGVAIDSFAAAPDSPLRDRDKRTEVVAAMVEALQGTTIGRARIEERQRAEQLLRSGAPSPEIRVLHDPHAAADATVLDVFAPDRVGLLHDIARAIHAAGATIVLARISTEGERAADAFYVVESEGNGPLDGTHRVKVERAIIDAIEEGITSAS